MMKTTLAIVLLFILCAGCSVPAEAMRAGTSVAAFGAKGDGVADDTAPIQSAISVSAAAGGGSESRFRSIFPQVATQWGRAVGLGCNPIEETRPRTCFACGGVADAGKLSGCLLGY